ncbi:MAG TPA: hypothetical protein VML58_05335 [Burkholderiaceae bacterium]|nr:hypothetical protein [Burkholderiaceae bacterium]
MFARSTLPVFAAVVSLVCGSSAGAEAFDPLTAQPSGLLRPSKPLATSGLPLGIGRDSIAPWPSSALRAEMLAWPDSASRTGSWLSFNRTPDDDRAGSSSASISLGRLNLNESRSGPVLGAASPADLERELAQLRENINRMRVVPQVSLGMRVKF